VPPNPLRTNRPFNATLTWRNPIAMNIAISAIGRYHMADLARQMLRLGQGVEVYTGNPKSHFDKDLHSHTHTFPYFHILTLLRGRIPPAPRTTWWHDRDMDSLGRWLARAVDPDTTDILDGLEGLGPACGRLMKARGKAWICNIATCHILDRVALGEEYRHWGAKAPKWSEANVNRVLAEIAECRAIGCASVLTAWIPQCISLLVRAIPNSAYCL